MNNLDTTPLDDSHPFVQLEQYNTCDWASITRLAVFTATVPPDRTDRMTISDIERDVTFNLLKIWGFAENQLPGKSFFTSDVTFDQDANLWVIAILLNITEGTNLTNEELDAKLLQIKTAEGLHRIY